MSHNKQNQQDQWFIMLSARTMQSTSYANGQSAVASGERNFINIGAFDCSIEHQFASPDIVFN